MSLNDAAPPAGGVSGSDGTMRPGALTPTVWEGFDGVDQWRANVDLLRAAQKAPTPNADPERFLATARALGDGVRSYVAVFRDARGTVRAAILGRRSRRVAAPKVGYVPTPSIALRCLDVVFGGLLSDGSLDAARAITDHLAGLLSGGALECVTVSHVDDADPLAPVLLARERGAVDRSARWSTPLGDAPMSRLSSKHRSTLRRKEKKLAEGAGGEIAMRVFSEPGDLDEFFRETSQLARLTWQRGIGGGFDDTAVWRGILEAEARAGRMRLYWLTCAGRPVAFQIGMTYAGRYYLETLGYDPRFGSLSPGVLLLVRSFVDLAEQRVAIFDFGFGDADYKKIYGVDREPDFTARLYAPGIRAGAAHGIDIGSRRAAVVARGMLERAGSVHAAKRWMRGLIGGKATKPAQNDNQEGGTQ